LCKHKINIKGVVTLYWTFISQAYRCRKGSDIMKNTDPLVDVSVAIMLEPRASSVDTLVWDAVVLGSE